MADDHVRGPRIVLEETERHSLKQIWAEVKDRSVQRSDLVARNGAGLSSGTNGASKVATNVGE